MSKVLSVCYIDHAKWFEQSVNERKNFLIRSFMEVKLLLGDGDA